MTEGDDRMVKVRFRLVERRPGWPPGESEGLWAEPVPDGYRLANTPFFADGCAHSDVVAASTGRDGRLWFDEVVRESGNCAIRIVVRSGGMKSAIDRFAALDVHGEGAPQYAVLALCVRPDVDLAAVVRLLAEGAEEGCWNWEEGWVTPAWHAAR
jgi:hypothetical protein